jgi:hypothetical protein
MPITASCASTDLRHYIWWFPGSPVKVHVDLCVIEGLQERLRDPGRGIAEQGLLFGRVLEGAIEISEYQPVSSRSVAETIEALAAEPRKRLLIGYYRTEHEEELRLNDSDVLLFKTFFGKPYHVFLLIQPHAFAPPNATFFLSRGDRKISEIPFLEFPLDVSLLATEEWGQISGCGQAAVQSITVAPSLPAASHHVPTGGSTLLKIAAGMLVSAFLVAAVTSSRPRPAR